MGAGHSALRGAELSLAWLFFLSIGAFFAILFTGRYPRPIFDFVLGMNRWILRVAAYAGLMTDRYPPFRLDMGGSEPGGTLTLPPPGPPYVPAGDNQPSAPPSDSEPGIQARDSEPGVPAWDDEVGVPLRDDEPSVPADDTEVVAPWTGAPLAGAPLAGAPLTGGPWAGAPMPGSVPPAGPRAGRTGWRAGRVVSVVIGSILVLASVGLISGGGFLLWAGQAHRQDGYLTTTANTFSTGGYALASDAFNVPSQASGAFASLVGKIRIRATAPNPAQPIFIGIAPAAAVARYLSGVPYATVSGFQPGAAQRTSHLGTAAPAPPAGLAIWTARASGTGTRSIVWTPRSGNWTVVVMNPDASRGVTARTDVGATIPGLPWIVTGLLVGGLLLVIAGIVLIVVPIRRVSVEAAG